MKTFAAAMLATASSARAEALRRRRVCARRLQPPAAPRLRLQPQQQPREGLEASVNPCERRAEQLHLLEEAAGERQARDGTDCSSSAVILVRELGGGKGERQRVGPELLVLGVERARLASHSRTSRTASRRGSRPVSRPEAHTGGARSRTLSDGPARLPLARLSRVSRAISRDLARSRALRQASGADAATGVLRSASRIRRRGRNSDQSEQCPHAGGSYLAGSGSLDARAPPTSDDHAPRGSGRGGASAPVLTAPREAAGRARAAREAAPERLRSHPGAVKRRAVKRAAGRRRRSAPEPRSAARAGARTRR